MGGRGEGQERGEDVKDSKKGRGRKERKYGREGGGGERRGGREGGREGGSGAEENMSRYSTNQRPVNTRKGVTRESVCGYMGVVNKPHVLVHA